jgi:lysophospholipase L1-like esterase
MKRFPPDALLLITLLGFTPGASAGTFTAAPGVAASDSGTAAPADTGRFAADIRRFEAADREKAPPAHPVLFVGSSSIRMWSSLAEDFPGVPVLNRGFGGSEAEDVLRYADRIVFPYRPRLVVLYEGDNDLAVGKSIDRVAGDLDSLITLIHRRLPGIPVAFISIKPSLARLNLLDAMREVNARIRARAAKDPDLHYVDVMTPMLDARGEPRPQIFLPDGLHMNAAGYAIWAKAVAPLLE